MGETFKLINISINNEKIILIVIFLQLGKIKTFLLCNLNQRAQVESHILNTQEKIASYFWMLFLTFVSLSKLGS